MQLKRRKKKKVINEIKNIVRGEARKVLII